jgi:MFS family permease
MDWELDRGATSPSDTAHAAVPCPRCNPEVERGRYSRSCKLYRCLAVAGPPDGRASVPARSSEIGLVLSSGFAGQFVGTSVAGWLAERFGRLRTTTATIAIFGVMSLCCAFAWSLESMLVFRFLQGIGLGGEVPVAAAYISEIAHAKNRGRFFTLYELMFPLGLLCTAVLAFWIVPWVGWRTMFHIGAAPAILVLFLRRLLPESPRCFLRGGSRMPKRWLPGSNGQLPLLAALFRRRSERHRSFCRSPRTSARPKSLQASTGDERWWSGYSGFPAIR